MKYVQNITILLVIFIFLSCGLEPEPINYGVDICAHCNMKIMDKRYGAELVSSKGKVFKFDSGECLIDYIYQNNISEKDNSQLLVTDFNNPGTLIKSGTATFIISQKLPSPMGAFLTAFSSRNAAQKKAEESGGDVYDWASVKEKIHNKQ
jgi:copper chaperone NosL